MSKIFKLTFKTDEDENYVINVPNADGSLSKEKIKQAMDQIVSSNVIVSSVGYLIEPVKAELIETVTSTVSL